MSLTAPRCALLLFSVGCACELPPIEGGSERTRANMEAAFEAFMVAVPEGAVCLSRLQVDEVPGGATGGYSRKADAIRIEERIDLPDHWRDREEWATTTHEACHAADDDLGIEAEARSEWNFETDHYEDSEIPREAFAYTCQFGAETIQLLGESCPEDTPGAEAFAFVLEHVYTRPFPGVVTVDHLRWEPVASTPFPGAAEIGIAVTGALDDTLRIALLDGSFIRYVSRTTGEPRALTAHPPLTEAAPEHLGSHGLVDVMGWATDGDAELLAVEAVAPNGGVARRLLYRDADGIGRLGCPRPQETVFVADGRLWSAYADGDDVEWGVWQAE